MTSMTLVFFDEKMAHVITSFYLWDIIITNM